MQVRVKKDFIFNELTGAKGQELELDEVLYSRLMRAGYIEDVKKPEKVVTEPVIDVTGITKAVKKKK